MFATFRRIALAVAGAAALVAASRARADPEWSQPPAYPPPAPQLSFSVELPAPPPWLAVAPPAYPVQGTWTRWELAREYRWLEAVRARFYRFGAWNPWRVRRFEAWYQVRRAELDRRWTALAWAPAPRGWREDRWNGRDDEWRRGRGGDDWRWNTSDRDDWRWNAGDRDDWRWNAGDRDGRRWDGGRRERGDD